MDTSSVFDSLPGEPSDWIAAGALIVSLAVALGQLFGYLRRRRAERLESEYQDWVYWNRIEGRARLSVSSLTRTTLLISNDGPEHAYNLQIRITTLNGEPLPYGIDPSS